MANELSTAGILVKYKSVTANADRPASGYTELPNIKSIPAINPEATALDATDLSDTDWKRYIDGLRDPGSDIPLTANLTSDLKNKWATIVSDARGNQSATPPVAAKDVWFEFMVPGIGSFYIKGIPQDLGFGGAEVDSIAEIELHITPKLVAGWNTSST